MRNKIIFVIVLLTAGLFVLSGCGADEGTAPGAESNPEQVVEQFIAAIHSLDLERAKTYVSSEYMEEFEYEFDELAMALEEDDPDAEFLRDLFSALMNNFQVSVTGHSIDGNVAIVNTLNTHPDPETFAEELMGSMFEVMFSGDIDFENLTEEEEMELFMGIILDVINDVEKVTSEAEVPMLKEDGQWKINGTVIAEYLDDLDF